MELSSSEKYFIEDAIEKFHEAIHSSSVALRHLSDFHNEGKMTEVLRSERRKIFTQCVQILQEKENSNLSQEKVVKHLDIEFQKVIEIYLEKNKSHKKQSDSVLEKLADYLCKEFKTSSELHLRRNRYIELGSLEAFLLSVKSELINNFSNHWKPGSSRFHQKWKMRLERKLDQLQREIEDKQKLFLDGPVEDEKNLFGELEKILLDRSAEIKKHVATLKLDYIPKSLLEGQIEEIKQLVDKSDSFSMRTHRNVHKKLLEIFTIAKIGVCMAEDKLLPKDAVSWADGLDWKLKKCFHDLKRESQLLPEQNVRQEQQQQQPQQSQLQQRSRSKHQHRPRFEVEINESVSTQSTESLEKQESISLQNERNEVVTEEPYAYEDHPHRYSHHQDLDLDVERSTTESIQDECEDPMYQLAQHNMEMEATSRVSVGNNTVEQNLENRTGDFDLKQLV